MVRQNFHSNDDSLSEQAPKVRTRIAPSPTGEDLHIGNVYTGLINFSFAKKHKGQFIIRIEDTDRERFVKGSEEKILASLAAFNLNFDEGPIIGGPDAPYRQSERLPLYHKYATKLLAEGHAEFVYYPKDQAGKKKDYTQKESEQVSITSSDQTPPQTIDEMISRKDWVVRMIIPRDQQVVFTDVIRGEITFETNQLSSQVLIKSDGFPTYHMGVVVDDYLMKISHVIRAEEWISSTPKHVLLYQALGWELPIFAHLPILRNPDRSKLSKRKNPVWASWYLQEGYLPEAILNFLALLGWSHPEEKEIFSLDEFIQLFDLKDIHPVGPIFDLTKLDWMNGVYIREQLTLDDVIQRLYEFNPELKKIEEKEFGQLVALARMRAKTLKNLAELLMVFVAMPKVTITGEQQKIKEDIKKSLTEITDWNTETVTDVIIQQYIYKKIISLKDLYKILVNTDKWLPLVDTFVILGKEKTLAFFA